MNVVFTESDEVKNLARSIGCISRDPSAESILSGVEGPQDDIATQPPWRESGARYDGHPHLISLPSRVTEMFRLCARGSYKVL